MKHRRVIAAFTAAAHLVLGAGLAYELVPAINNVYTSPAWKDAAEHSILSTRPHTEGLTFVSAKQADDPPGFVNHADDVSNFFASKVLKFKFTGTSKEHYTEIVTVRCNQEGFGGGKIKCAEPGFSELSSSNVKIPKQVQDAFAKRLDINGFH
jgi:hypothetical protein